MDGRKLLLCAEHGTRGVAAGRSAQRGTSGAATGGGGPQASYPDSFWWSERPSKEAWTCRCREPVQTASEEADRVVASTVGGYLTCANSGFAEQHAAPDRQHDRQEQSLRALRLQHTTELPFERTTFGIPKQRFDVHTLGVQVCQTETQIEVADQQPRLFVANAPDGRGMRPAAVFHEHPAIQQHVWGTGPLDQLAKVHAWPTRLRAQRGIALHAHQVVPATLLHQLDQRR